MLSYIFTFIFNTFLKMNQRNYNNSSKTILRKRGQIPTIAITSLVIIILLIYTWFEESLQNTIELFCEFILILILIEYIIRLCYFFEEIRYLKTDYKNLTSLIQDVFYTNVSIYITIMICLFFLIFKHHHLSGLNFKNMSIRSCFVFLASFLTIHLLKVYYSPLYISQCINNICGLDYGSGMAHSFFSGYLNIVLPNHGTESKGLKELMKDYESNGGVKFGVYKLFILIPLSLKCPTSLSEISENIGESSSLESIYRDRAGVKNRVYKNSVYKVKIPSRNKKVYVAVEYATPLRTLQDVIQTNHPHAKYYKKYTKEILKNFYTTLKGLLDMHDDCQGLCELIYYNDVDNNVDIADLLLSNICRLIDKEKNYCL